MENHLTPYQSVIIEIKNDYIRHHADSICDIINDLALNHCDDRAM